MKFLITCFILCFSLPSLAQGEERLNEVKDGMRFIRLAETRKNLDFSDEKLLQLNERLDSYEETRIKLRMRERRLTSALRKDKTDSNSLLDEYQSLKKEGLENELSLIKDVRAMLTPDEAVAFFRFYQSFNRDVQRRIRRLQDRPMRRKMRGR